MNVNTSNVYYISTKDLYWLSDMVEREIQRRENNQRRNSQRSGSWYREA